MSGLGSVASALAVRRPTSPLLRQLCVERHNRLEPREFEDVLAACNLLPGPASTQLAIFCGWRLRGRTGALVGGACFIVPGLILILGLAASSSRAPRRAGSKVPEQEPVPPLRPSPSAPARVVFPTVGAAQRAAPRWVAYLAAGAAAAATIGPWLVLVLLACGLLEATISDGGGGSANTLLPLPLLAIDGQAVAFSHSSGLPSKSVRFRTAAAS